MKGRATAAKRPSAQPANAVTPQDFQIALATRLAALGLRAEDFVEKFARSGGPGGQHVNKVSTAVSLRHVPSGASVTVQDSRSQAVNRRTAWLRLIGQIEKARAAAAAEKKSAREKIRRQKRPRPWGLKQRILDEKKRRGEIKKLRRGI
jgi:protein subunit release factor B